MVADIVKIKGESHRTDFTGTMGFGVRKNLKGRDWKTDDSFQFELSAPQGAPMPSGATNENGRTKKTVDITYSNRTPSFGVINYKEGDIGKTYTYELKELVGSVSGISYSEVVYTIQVSVESNNGQGIKLIRKYSTDGGESWTEGLPENETFSFTNEWKDEKGSLTITKKVVDEDADFSGTFYFTVRQGSKYFDKDGKSTNKKIVHELNYANGTGSITLSNLPTGTYVVTEVADAKGTEISSAFPYTVSNISGNVEVKKDGTSYEVTNTKKTKNDNGNLKITKVITGEIDDKDLKDDQRAEITFTITGPNNFVKTIHYNEFDNGSFVLKDLPVGTYQVEETGADFFIEYVWSVTYNVANGETTVEKDKTAEVIVTNTYGDESETGSLEVKKTFADNALTEEQKAAVEFTVTGPNNYSASKTYAEFVNGSWKLENLPVGEYTVTESNADVAGYTRTTVLQRGRRKGNGKQGWKSRGRGNQQLHKRPWKTGT